MITSEATGKVEEKAGLVEVMKAFIKEYDETQREEIEFEMETGFLVIYISPHKHECNIKPNTNVNLALQVGIKRRHETR